VSNEKKADEPPKLPPVRIVLPRREPAKRDEKKSHASA
jgi:hypothetical protein